MPGVPFRCCLCYTFGQEKWLHDVAQYVAHLRSTDHMAFKRRSMTETFNPHRERAICARANLVERGGPHLAECYEVQHNVQEEYNPITEVDADAAGLPAVDIAV